MTLHAAQRVLPGVHRLNRGGESEIKADAKAKNGFPQMEPCPRCKRRGEEIPQPKALELTRCSGLECGIDGLEATSGLEGIGEDDDDSDFYFPGWRDLTSSPSSAINPDAHGHRFHRLVPGKFHRPASPAPPKANIISTIPQKSSCWR